VDVLLSCLHSNIFSTSYMLKYTYFSIHSVHDIYCSVFFSIKLGIISPDDALFIYFHKLRETFFLCFYNVDFLILLKRGEVKIDHTGVLFDGIIFFKLNREVCFWNEWKYRKFDENFGWDILLGELQRCLIFLITKNWVKMLKILLMI